MSREIVAAGALFDKALWVPLHDMELLSFQANANIESTARAFPAIGAMAIIGRTDFTRILVLNAST
jgi:hypothetical protein